MPRVTLACLCLCFTLIAEAREPSVNLSLVRQSLEQYHDGGQYNKDIQITIAQAEKSLAAHMRKNLHPNKKPAILLDIDETSLSNYPEMKKLNFGGSNEEMSQMDNETHDPVIAPTLALFNYASTHHIAVIFVTGRKEVSREATIQNLHNAGYSGWDKLILRDATNEHTKAVTYKTAARKQLTQEGYDIILNIGDQKSDLEGGFADYTYKLPNPYYYIG